ncbi:hypothetical protein FWH13_00505 [Candidatus Saccharibacteria bacterium]|nr:hypothetical protein [Candidatus Saccharibacteria bacterium]
MRKIVLPLFGLLTAAFLALNLAGAILRSDVAAQEPDPSISLSVSPAQQRLSLEPGGTSTAEVVIINSGTEGYDIRVSATPYEVAPDYTHNIFDREGVYSQIHRWITFNGQTTFRLEPGERKTVTFTVNVPISVPAGGQYAGIMAETIPPADASGVVAIRRVASLLYANLAGDTIETGSVTDRVWRSFYPSRDVTTSLTIQNTGNTDFSVENHLFVDSLFGRRIAEVTEPARVIFPDTSRTFELNWQSARSVGAYRITQQSAFLHQSITETKLIVIMPVWFIISAIMAVFTIVILIILSVKRRRSTDYYAS